MLAGWHVVSLVSRCSISLPSSRKRTASPSAMAASPRSGTIAAEPPANRVQQPRIAALSMLGVVGRREMAVWRQRAKHASMPAGRYARPASVTARGRSSRLLLALGAVAVVQAVQRHDPGPEIAGTWRMSI